MGATTSRGTIHRARIQPEVADGHARRGCAGPGSARTRPGQAGSGRRRRPPGREHEGVGGPVRGSPKNQVPAISSLNGELGSEAPRQMATMATNPKTAGRRRKRQSSGSPGARLHPAGQRRATAGQAQPRPRRPRRDRRPRPEAARSTMVAVGGGGAVVQGLGQRLDLGLSVPLEGPSRAGQAHAWGHGTPQPFCNAIVTGAGVGKGRPPRAWAPPAARPQRAWAGKDSNLRRLPDRFTVCFLWPLGHRPEAAD